MQVVNPPGAGFKEPYASVFDPSAERSETGTSRSFLFDRADIPPVARLNEIDDSGGICNRSAAIFTLGSQHCSTKKPKLVDGDGRHS
jgi:hypothetical protein